MPLRYVNRYGRRGRYCFLLPPQRMIAAQPVADFIGLDVCLDIMRVLEEGLGDPKYRPCPLLRRMVAAGHLGRKSGQGFYTY